jgi:hypothetical protein
MTQIRKAIRQWWHIGTALVAGSWILGAAVFGWVDEVDAFMDAGDRLTPAMADSVYVRKDVQSEQLRRIEQQLIDLNENFRRHLERDHE